MKNNNLLLGIYLLARKFLLFPLLITRRTVSPLKESIKTILILRYDRIGDMVLSTPLFESLKKHIPGCRIIVLASEKNKEVIYNNPYVDEIVLYKGAVKFMLDFRQRGIDLAIDPFYTYELKSAFLAFLSGAKYRVGFEEAGREAVFNIKGPRLYPFTHMVYHLLDLLMPLGIRENEAHPKIYLTEEEIGRAKNYFTQKNFKEDGLKIAVHPGAYYPSQRWPAERFAELIQKVGERFGVRVIVFTDKAEEDLRQKIISVLGPTRVDPVHGLELRQFMAYLSQCHLLICNNTGPLHIAAGLGVPTVSIMGPTRPDLWRPFGAGHLVINKNASCSPCGRGVCGSHYCMNSVSAGEVLEMVEEQIHKIQNGIKDKIIDQNAFRISGFKKILIINLGGIGDILLSTPALEAIRKRYPAARISLAVVPRVYETVKDLPYIDEVFLLDIDLGTRGVWNNLKALAALRRRGFDLAVNMRTLASNTGALKIRLLFAVINPKVSAGRDTDGRGGFFDIRIDETALGEKYERDYDMDVARFLGAETADRSIEINVDEASLKKVESMLREGGITAEDILIDIHVGGKPSHRWPVGNYLEVISLLNKSIDCKFCITGDKKDSRIINGLIKNSGAKIIDMTGRLTFKELAALIKICKICVFNDTGPMHIASILGTPLVAIFGPGYLTRFDPRNISDKAAVLYKKTDCAPCDRAVCASMKCLKAITPREVADKCLELLEKARI